MCGIAGILSKNPDEITIDRLKKMTDVINYRGPDGHGHWVNPENNVGLGHRRLSIIDLSHEADQPMHYLNRYSIVFNGEIYNYIELKEILITQGYQFSTSSDTEVLMALYDRDKENCLQLLDGMFSFVIYDSERKEVFAARDRFGEKPFFYNYKPGEYLIFGSEMKVLWSAGVAREYDQNMLYNFLTYQLIDNPGDLSQTFFKGCKRLEHAHYLIFDINTFTITSLKKYWDLDIEIQQNKIDTSGAEEKFHSLFKTSVSRRLRSDVAVGSSLSGGLDSSAIVWQINNIRKNSGIQKTFSARFPGYSKDEGQYMQMIIDRTNVEPHFVYPDGGKMAEDMDNLFYHQEEPFPTSSIYAQYCVMRLAKENNVTVLLDGQGADEILAGYHSYFMEFFKELRKNDPLLYKKEYKAYKDLQSSNITNTIIKKDSRFFLKTFFPKSLGSIKKIDVHKREILDPFLDKEFFNSNRKSTFMLSQQFDKLNAALYESTMKGLLQGLLRYADRNSMAHGREVRLPFLNHELVSFVFSLPPNFKIKNGWTKWILRQSFKDALPADICWRKEKVGFQPPQNEWVKNKNIAEKFNEAKKKLIKEKILNRKLENIELLPADSWNVLMSGYVI